MRLKKLANDPQPDLARSSAGAYYYWLRHGWMRWNFGAGFCLRMNWLSAAPLMAKMNCHLISWWLAADRREWN
jgi:hypothetical protein